MRRGTQRRKKGTQRRKKRELNDGKRNSAKIKRMGRPRDCEQNGNNIFHVPLYGRITKQEPRQENKFTPQVNSPESLSRMKVDGIKDIHSQDSNQETVQI